MAPNIGNRAATWTTNTKKVAVAEMTMRLQILKDEVVRLEFEILNPRKWHEANPKEAEVLERAYGGSLKAEVIYTTIVASTMAERKARWETEITELEKKLEESRKLGEANSGLQSNDNQVLNRIGELESMIAIQDKVIEEKIEERDKLAEANSALQSKDNKMSKRIGELKTVIATKDKLVESFESILRNGVTFPTIDDKGEHPTLTLLRKSKEVELDLREKIHGLKHDLYELMLVNDHNESQIKSLSVTEANSELLSPDNKLENVILTKDKLLENVEERGKLAEAKSEIVSHDKKLSKRIEELESKIETQEKLLAIFNSILKNDSAFATMDEDGTHPTLKLLRESKKNERDIQAKVKELETQLEELIDTRDENESKIKSLSAANGKYKVETNKLKDDISFLRSRVQELERSYTNSLSTKSRLEDRIVELQKQVGDRNAELKEFDGLLGTARQDLKLANKTKAEFQSHLRDCETEKTILRGRVALADNIREDLANQKRYNAELKKRVVEFGDQIDQALEKRRGDFATYEGDIRSVQSFDLDYRDSTWDLGGGAMLNNSVSNTSGRSNQSKGEHIPGELTLESDLGSDNFGSRAGSPASTPTASSFTPERNASIASTHSARQGRGPLQGNPFRQSQPTSAPYQSDGLGKRRRTDFQYPRNSLDSGPHTSARPSAAGSLGSMRTTSSIFPEDGSGVTPRPSSRKGRDSLHEGTSTKGHPMGTLAQTESHTAGTRTESLDSKGRAESHTTGTQTASLDSTGRTESHSTGTQTERTEIHSAGTQTERIESHNVGNQTEGLEPMGQTKSHIEGRIESHTMEPQPRSPYSSLSSDSSPDGGVRLPNFSNAKSPLKRRSKGTQSEVSSPPVFKDPPPATLVAASNRLDAKSPMENHSAGSQAKKPDSPSLSGPFGWAIRRWLKAKSPPKSSSAGTQTITSYFPEAPDIPIPPTCLDANTPPKSQNTGTQTRDSFYPELLKSHSAGTQTKDSYSPELLESPESPKPPEFQECQESPKSAGSTRTGVSSITAFTSSNQPDSVHPTLPIKSDIHHTHLTAELTITAKAETPAAPTVPEIRYIEQTVDRPFLVEMQNIVLIDKRFTSSRLYRYGSPILLLLALAVLVLMMLDISNEKEKWLASNETTRQMAWVMRAGGSYGFPFLSWLFHDAYLEVNAYSYG